MIKVFREDNGHLVSSTHENNDFSAVAENVWIDISSPTLDTLKELSKMTSLPLDFLVSALDSEESARADYDEGNTLIVLDTPVERIQSEKKETKPLFETIPFVIIYNQSYYVTLHQEESNLINQLVAKSKLLEPHKHVRMTLHLLFTLAQNFIASLKRIDARSRAIESRLHSSMKNKELFDLMELNKMLVYFSTALNADKAVSERLKKTADYKKYEDDYDLMEDVQVELNQAIEMCSIYRDILAGMMDAFASIISNNLNIVMKVLAILTIVLSIPTLIASFYGMNINSGMPLQDTPNSFWIIIAISAFFALIGGVALIVFEKRHKR
ncbi:MAG: magnesium transporter CorA family protein [Bacilli bacterium]|jgi:magnesium transporter|nr:magnesium transporter CorA family protein [Bacilli bacterium]